MGIISSICKRKDGDLQKSVVQGNSTKSSPLSTNLSGDKTQCSAISREPTNSSSFRYHYYLPCHQVIYPMAPAKQIREFVDFPFNSTPFYVPFQDNSDIFHQQTNLGASRTLIDDQNYPRNKVTTSTTVPTRCVSVSDLVQTTEDNNEMEFSSRNTNAQSIKQNSNDESHLVKRSTSTPIDMFLIDISKENVLINQPVSINIRHLLLDTLENRHKNSKTPICIEPVSTTTYAHKNLLDYIPYVCERYPNVTVEPDRRTRNTLHIRVPSQFSHSFDALT